MQINITAQNYEVSDDLDKYINKKLAKAKRLVPKGHRDDTSVQIKLEEFKSSNSERFQCEMIMQTYPKQNLVVKERGVNMFAAVDVCQAKLNRQLRKHKDAQQKDRKNSRQAIQKLRRLADRDFRGRQN